MSNFIRADGEFFLFYCELSWIFLNIVSSFFVKICSNKKLPRRGILQLICLLKCFRLIGKILGPGKFDEMSFFWLEKKKIRFGKIPMIHFFCEFLFEKKTWKRRDLIIFDKWTCRILCCFLFFFLKIFFRDLVSNI